MFMDIKDQLLEDMKAAMKAHDMEQLGTIRFLRSAIQNAQIDGAGDDDNLDRQGEASEAGAEGAGRGCREVASCRDAKPAATASSTK